jgi:PAS domain S-box-containing protein
MPAAARHISLAKHLSGDDLLSLLIETATNHALFTLDRRGNVNGWNSGAERILGYRAGEIIGQSSARFYPDADRAGDAPQRALDAAAAQGRYEEEGVRLRKDGREFPAEIVIYPIRGRNGLAVGYVKIIRDVTGRVERDRALAASAAKSRLLAQLGHEFRTPLNAIIGFSEVMKRKVYGGLGDPRYADYVDDIHESGLHLYRLAEGILDLVRNDNDKATPIWQPVDVNEVVGYVMRLMRGKADDHGIRLISVASGDCVSFNADERMVRQCLINLIDNALKYSPAGTRVTISVARDAQWLGFTVSDQGRGIPKDAIARALEPFQQVGEDAERGQDGVGLGLALVKSFCEAHGGQLHIDSAPGAGTRATVKFPYPGGIANMVAPPR